MKLHSRRLPAALIVILALPFGQRALASDQATVEAARKEGTVVIYNSMTPSQMQLLENVFKAKYPFLEVKVFRAVGERLLTKIMTEAQAGRHEFDIREPLKTLFCICCYSLDNMFLHKISRCTS
jgi:hypothetical protein